MNLSMVFWIYICFMILTKNLHFFYVCLEIIRWIKAPLTLRIVQGLNFWICMRFCLSKLMNKNNKKHKLVAIYFCFECAEFQSSWRRRELLYRNKLDHQTDQTHNLFMTTEFVGELWSHLVYIPPWGEMKL